MHTGFVVPANKHDFLGPSSTPLYIPSVQELLPLGNPMYPWDSEQRSIVRTLPFKMLSLVTIPYKPHNLDYCVALPLHIARFGPES